MITIDLDKDEVQRPLSMRERVGIYILMIVFQMIYPLKYTHQLKDLFAELKGLGK